MNALLRTTRTIDLSEQVDAKLHALRWSAAALAVSASISVLTGAAAAAGSLELAAAQTASEGAEAAEAANAEAANAEAANAEAANAEAANAEAANAEAANAEAANAEVASAEAASAEAANAKAATVGPANAEIPTTAQINLATLPTGDRTRHEMLEAVGLSAKEAHRLLSQHPGLDRPQVYMLIARVKVRAARDGRVYSNEDFMSKFALFASEMVGWVNENP